MLYLYASSGSLAETKASADSNNAYWSSAEQAVFDVPLSDFYPIEKVPISAGAIGAVEDPAFQFSESYATSTPIRFSGDGSLLVDSKGIVYSTSTLNQVGALGGSMVDAAWPGASLFTLNQASPGSVVQKWSGAGLLLSQSVPIPGYPERLWPLPGGGLGDDDGGGCPDDDRVGLIGRCGWGRRSQITTEPLSETVSTGATVTFTAASSGQVTYQWQCDGVNLADGADVWGATGPQLVLENADALNAGSYTCVVTNANGSSYSTPANLVVQTGGTPGTVGSISARSYVGTADNVLIGGFYINGSTSCTVLVQAIGPGLAGSPYNVSGVLREPKLTIHQTQNGKDVTLYSNTGWGSSPVLAAAASSAYAQPVLQPGSADSELLVTLPPGGYTAEVSGA